MAETVLTNVEELMELLNDHIADTNNPHSVTKAQIPGLDNVDNTADLNKPISVRTQVALDTKSSIADIYDELVDAEGVDLKHKPISAHLGVSLKQQIDALDPENWDDQIQDLDNRITAIETWTD